MGSRSTTRRVASTHNLSVDINNSTITDNAVSSNEDGFGAGISHLDGVLSVTNSTISENGSDDTDVFGGGVGESTQPGDPATFSNDVITDNNAYDGGGLVLYDGDTTITNTTISDNEVFEAGGGVFNDTDDASTTTIASSTISDNTMPQPVGVSEYFGDGGGVASVDCSQLSLTNDTISGNEAFNEGGGYYGDCNLSGGPVQPSGKQPQVAQANKPHEQANVTEADLSTAFLFDTVSDNTSLDDNSAAAGGNVQLDDEVFATMGETIVAGGIVGASPTTNCEIGPDASFTSNGYNLIDDTTCGTPGTGDIIGQNAQLGALGANGGPTNTELPATGSPAIGGVPAGVWQRHRRDDRPAGCGPGNRQRHVHNRCRRGVGGGTARNEPQRVPLGGQRGRHLRLRAELPRLLGQQPPQRADHRHRQLTGL